MRCVKTGAWVAVFASVSISACNYSEGDCYLRGQSESAGVGGGVIVPSGAGGGYGDTPPPGGNTAANACNAPEERSEPMPPTEGGPPSFEAGLKVLCLKKDWGVPCADLCAAKNVPCGPIAAHPQTKGVGAGQLYSCNDMPIGIMCGYHYADGSDCYYFYTLGAPRFPLCFYSGTGHD